MFHPLRVSEVERLTDDSVTVTFAVPPELDKTFRHTPGQHIALRRVVAGEEIRRTYSICAPAGERPVLRVGIRLVEGGEFSTYALKELAVGDTVDVMEPTGRFLLAPRAGTSPPSSAAAASRRCCRSPRHSSHGSRMPGSV